MVYYQLWKHNTVLISSEAAPTFEMPGLFVQGLASPSRGAKETSVWRLTLAPGAAGAPHSVTREEVFVALSGEATMTLDGAPHVLKAGDALVVAPGITIVASNPNDAPFEAVAVLPVGGQAVTKDAVFTPPWAV